ncbi:subtilisin-like protein [Rhodocollybia butyracea]|uniref:tripeptidyl-peptidase II n=1 Tax=Rhodocollybia butyracea TaxID=206335 RepID=A0A9P5QA09_9AGAR|nr:subtilisin-like protein [Rhodocollybia butyracea]
MFLHDRRDSIPNGFTQIGVASDDTILHMRINIEMGNRTGLEDALNKASDPSHENYGQWLSKEDIQYYAAPTREALHSVRKWLSSNNIDSQSATVSGDWIKFNVSVGTANTMLNASYSVFEYTASGQQFVRTLEYSVPEDLKEHVKAIHPTGSLIKRKSFNTTAQSSNCNEAVTPACIQKLYGLPTTLVNSNTSITIGGFRPDMPSSTTFGTVLWDDAANSQNISDAGDEANLDIQYTIGLANGIPTTFFDVGSTNNDGMEPPLVLTTSYGGDLNGDENGVSIPLAFAMCDALMKLTARGVSILYASGDGGVSGFQPNDECNGKSFWATWPASCPYVTSVGATGNIPETAAALSSGGFSNLFEQPSWQQNAVATYLNKTGNLYEGLYNRTGRGYPDVSAQGENIQIIMYGEPEPVNGTSASSPIFAAIIALLNDELSSAGKPSLGFLNPWIYAHPEAFNDITSGSNPGCGTDGFPALPGWDPVTGVGSPNYPAMRKALGLS